MDLREKVSFFQRVSEYSIRFRLVEILAMVVLCSIARLNIEGILFAMQSLSAQTEKIVRAFIHQDFQAITSNYGIAFAVLALFIFRWIFFGFKCGLLWFLFLLFNALFLIAIGDFKDIMQILIACIFIIASSCFFFIRSLIAKSILPLIILAYSLSTWMLFLGISNPIWYGLVSMFFADTFHLIFVIAHQICKDAKNKKTLNGAIIHGVRKTIPVSLLSAFLLIAMEMAFYFTGHPTLASEKLLHSIIIYVCYILWMPFFTVAILSFCPLENTCKKMQEKLK